MSSPLLRSLSLSLFFFFNDPAPTEISPLPLPDALPIFARSRRSTHAATWYLAPRCSRLAPRIAPTTPLGLRLAMAPPIPNHPQTPAPRKIASNAAPSPRHSPQTWVHPPRTQAKTRTPATTQMPSSAPGAQRERPTAPARDIPQIFLDWKMREKA